MGAHNGFRSKRGPDTKFSRRSLSSQIPESKSSSSNMKWQAGTAAALIATYCAVNAGLKYYEESSDDDEEYLDGPGRLIGSCCKSFG